MGTEIATRWQGRGDGGDRGEEGVRLSACILRDSRQGRIRLATAWWLRDVGVEHAGPTGEVAERGQSKRG